MQPDQTELPTDEDRIAYWQGAYERMAARNHELAAECKAMSARAEWQQYEIAPKDGTQIVAEVMNGYFQVIHWADEAWRENTNMLALRKPFLRWASIPAAAPSAGKDRA